MLSISSVTAGMAQNYWWQGESKENYYEAGEEKGKALSGFDSEKVDWKEALETVSDRIRQNSGRDINPEKDKFAEDLTFSAHKSVSIAWGLAKASGDEKTAQKIEGAFDKAIQDTFEFLKQNDFFQTRDQDGKPIDVNPESIKAVQFTHHVSRNNDPQLHAHVVILNSVERASDGKQTAHYLAEIYNNKKEIGAVFQGILGHHLETAGFKTERYMDVRNGNSFAIGLAGFTQEQIKAFSTRGQEIKEKMDERGLSDTKSAEKIALETRNTKDPLTSEFKAEMEKEWLQRAEQHDIRMKFQGGKSPIEKLTENTTGQKAAEQAMVSHLNLNGKIDQKQMLLEGAVALRDHGVSFSLEKLQHTAGHALNEVGASQGGLVKLQDGSLTTRTLLASELKTKINFGWKTKASINEKHVDYHLGHYNASLQKNKGYTLSKEQTEMVKGALYSKNHVVVEGRAGAGKTTSLDAMKDVAERMGFSVIGVASSGSAAEKLSKEINIRTYTAEGLAMIPEKKIQQETKKNRTIIIVDESSMLSAKQGAAILDRAKMLGAKIVAVGDRAQLGSVGHGNVMSEWVDTAKENGSYFELKDVRRQQGEYKEIANDLRPGSGKGEQALERLKEKGWLHESKNINEMVNKVTEEYLSKTKEGKETMIIADTRALVKNINEKVREKLIKQGSIQTERISEFKTQDTEGKDAGLKQFAIGDKIMFLQNSKSHEVFNGETGIIQAIDKSGNLYVLKDGSNVTVKINPTSELNLVRDQKVGLKIEKKEAYRAIDYAYARTIHKSQGQEADHTIMATTGAKNVNANMLYVGVTRGKGSDGITIHTTNFEKLKETMTRQSSHIDLTYEHSGIDRKAQQHDIKNMQKGQIKALFSGGKIEQTVKASRARMTDMANELKKEMKQHIGRQAWLGLKKNDQVKVKWQGELKLLEKAMEKYAEKSERLAPDEAKKEAVKEAVKEVMKEFKSDLKQEEVFSKQEKMDTSWDSEETIKSEERYQEMSKWEQEQQREEGMSSFREAEQSTRGGFEKGGMSGDGGSRGGDRGR